MCLSLVTPPTPPESDLSNFRKRKRPCILWPSSLNTIKRNQPLLSFPPLFLPLLFPEADACLMPSLSFLFLCCFFCKGWFWFCFHYFLLRVGLCVHCIWYSSRFRTFPWEIDFLWWARETTGREALTVSCCLPTFHSLVHNYSISLQNFHLSSVVLFDHFPCFNSTLRVQWYMLPTVTWYLTLDVVFKGCVSSKAERKNM